MVRYSPEIIRQVAEANDIVDIVSQYASLKKKGRTYMGCCPFHSEKTPSFSVDREKQLYHCFGCGAGGDLYRFVMEKENMQFPEALRFLADKAGIELPTAGYDSREEQVREAARKRVFEMHRRLANHYYLNLKKSEPAKAYLTERGVTPELIKKFGLGYALPEWRAGLQMLTGLGFTQDEILKAGLALPGKDGRNAYDRFRGRIVFPIQNTFDKVIGFGARKIDAADNGPKYLNSPETDIFVKGTQLYNLNRARRALSGKPLLLVEGYMDVIALSGYGFENAAAALGTAFTPQHARLIGRYTKDIVLCFDGDRAGEKATFKALDVLEDSELNIRIIRLPEEHDPDTFIRANGTDAFQKRVDTAVPAVDFRLSVLEREHDLSASAGKLKFVHEACALLKKLGAIEREYYAGKVAGLSGINQQIILSQSLSERTSENPSEPERRQAAPVKKPKKSAIPKELSEAQRFFMKYCYDHPEALESVSEDMLSYTFYRVLYTRLKALDTPSPGAAAIFAEESNPHYSALLSKLLLEGEAVDENLYRQSVDVITRYAHKQRLRAIKAEMLTADAARKQELSKQLIALKRADWS